MATSGPSNPRRDHQHPVVAAQPSEDGQIAGQAREGHRDREPCQAQRQVAVQEAKPKAGKGHQQRNDVSFLLESAHGSGNVLIVAMVLVMPKSLLDGEPLDFDKKLVYMTDSEEFSGLNEREEMETQLIR